MTPPNDNQSADLSALPDTPCSTSYLQPLFNHMAQDHGLTLVESEMHDIINICEDVSGVKKLLARAWSGRKRNDLDIVEDAIFRRAD